MFYKCIAFLASTLKGEDGASTWHDFIAEQIEY